MTAKMKMKTMKIKSNINHLDRNRNNNHLKCSHRSHDYLHLEAKNHNIQREIPNYDCEVIIIAITTAKNKSRVTTTMKAKD